MNLDNLTSTEDCIVTKNEPSFYYDSGLEEDLKKPIEITIQHDEFQSVFDCIYDGIIIYRGDTLERYYCKSYIQGTEVPYCLDFKFTIFTLITFTLNNFSIFFFIFILFAFLWTLKTVLFCSESMVAFSVIIGLIIESK